MPLPVPPPEPPVPWVVDLARYEVRHDGDEAEVTLDYAFRSVGTRWAELRIAGPGLRVSEVTGPATAGPGGLYVVLDPARSTHRVEVRGRVPLTGGEVRLPVLPAARQEVRASADGLTAQVPGAVDGAMRAAEELVVRFVPPAVRAASPAAVVLAEVGTAAWVADGALQVRAAVRWNVARGAVRTFDLAVPPLDDLQVTGAQVARWTRLGSTVRVEAHEEVRGRFDVTVEGRAAAPATPTPVPGPRPLDVRRVEAWWAVGRSDDGELLPSPGRRGVSARQVPEWVRGLSDTPVGSWWAGETPVEVQAARYEVVPGPDAVVERASFVVVTNEDGRVLIRGTWLVRNDRRQFLSLAPPPGFTALTARVSSEPERLLQGEGGTVLVPLPRSLETIRGLLAVPVEVVFLGGVDALEGRGEAVVTAPAADAPVQEVRWEVHLPRSFERRGRTEDVLPVYDARREAAQAMLDRAVVAYQNNEFEEARSTVELLDRSGLGGEESTRLAGNLEVLLDQDASDDLVARRVRDLANARTVELQVAQERAAESADEALRKGDTAAAREHLEAVASLGKKIAPTEQAESREQDDRLAQAKDKLAKLEPARPPPPPPLSPPPAPAPAPVPATTVATASTGTVMPVEVPAPEQPVVLEPEFLARIPTGRSFAGGVANVRPAADEEEANALTEGAPKSGETTEASRFERVDATSAHQAPSRQAVTRDLAVQEVVVVRGRRSARGAPTPAPPRPAIDACARAVQLSLPAPPGCPGAASEGVRASPFTVALPLAGSAVGATQALLPADVAPVLTVPYRPRKLR